jgi:hypothetical protein
MTASSSKLCSKHRLPIHPSKHTHSPLGVVMLPQLLPGHLYCSLRRYNIPQAITAQHQELIIRCQLVLRHLRLCCERGVAAAVAAAACRQAPKHIRAS